MLSRGFYGILARRQGALDLEPALQVGILAASPRGLAADRVSRPWLGLRKPPRKLPPRRSLDGSCDSQATTVSAADDQTRLPRSAFACQGGRTSSSTRSHRISPALLATSPR
jgi:hypothetical protein